MIRSSLSILEKLTCGIIALFFGLLVYGEGDKEVVNPPGAKELIEDFKKPMAKGGSRGGGGCDAISCGSGTNSKRMVLPFVRTRHLEKDEIRDVHGQKVDFSNGISLKKGIPKEKFCDHSMALIQKRLKLLGATVGSKYLKNISEEFQDYMVGIQNARKNPKSTAKISVAVQESECSTANVAVTYRNLNSNEGSNSNSTSLFNDNQLLAPEIDGCDEKTIRRIAYRFFSYDKEKHECTQNYAMDVEAVKQFETGTTDGSEADLQCSYLHIHEFLTRYMIDPALVDFYTKLLHSKTFLDESVPSMGGKAKLGLRYQNRLKKARTSIAQMLVPEGDPAMRDLSANFDRASDEHPFNIFLSFKNLGTVIQESKIIEYGTYQAKPVGTPSVTLKPVSSIKPDEATEEPSSKSRTYSPDLIETRIAAEGPNLTKDQDFGLRVSEVLWLDTAKFRVLGRIGDKIVLVRLPENEAPGLEISKLTYYAGSPEEIKQKLSKNRK